MKQIKKLFLLIIMLFTSISVVKASEKLNYEWGVYSEYEYLEDYISTEENVYIMGSSEVYNSANKTLVEKYDITGELIDQNYGKSCYTIKAHNDTFLCVASSSWRDSYLNFLFIDPDGKVIKEVNIENLKYSIDSFMEDENYYYAYDLSNQVLQIKKSDLTYSLIDLSTLSPEEKIKLIGDEYYINEFYSNHPYGRNYLDFSKTEDYYVFSTMNEDDIGMVYVYDQEGNEKTKLEIASDMRIAAEATTSGMYIVSASLIDPEACYKNDECEMIMSISKYDYEGNLIYKEDFQTVNVFNGNPSYGSHYDFGEGRTVSKMIFKNNKLFISLNFYVSPESITDEVEGIKGALLVFSTSYNIETKYDKNQGTIEVVDTEMAGTPVTFVVTPKEGYELKEVKVTDDNGNVVTFTDYTFTMPSADVTIEAIFIKEQHNPETADILIILFIITAIISTILIIKNKKKLEWME